MEQLKEKYVVIVLESEEQKSRLAERIAQAGRTGFMGGCAPPKTPRRCAAASGSEKRGERGELRITATKWQTNENHNTKESAELQL